MLRLWYVYWRTEGRKRVHTRGPFLVFENAEREADLIREKRKTANVWIRSEEA